MSTTTSTYEAKDGDTPTIREILRDKSGRSISVPVGSTVTFRLQKVLPQEEAETSSTGVLNDAATGDVQYTLTTAQTAMAAGQVEPDVYQWEFEVTNTGFQITGPSQGHGKLTIYPNLAT